jgi:hypothetical protein
MRSGNLAAVMKTMGHGDVKTAMRYQHPELEVVRAALLPRQAEPEISQPASELRHSLELIALGGSSWIAWKRRSSLRIWARCLATDLKP